MNNIVTSQTYDRHILAQGLEFQIEKYYAPKEASLLRRIRIVLDAIAPKANERILDIGCGVGTFAYHCATAGTLSTGIDYSLESIRVARDLSQMFNISDRTDFIVANAKQLPFRTESFDKVVAIDFIEHITDSEKKILLSEMRRVLKNHGWVIIFTPNKTREIIGQLYWKVRSKFTGEKIPATDLHYGLTTRSDFESLLKEFNFSFSFKYADITRPYLAKIPLLRNFLALELLWILKK